MPESHPVQPAAIGGLSPSGQVYLNELKKFTPVDWQNWVERVCANQPRRPITPIVDASPGQVFSYTYNLLDRHAPLLKTMFVDTVFRKFAQTSAVPANAPLLSKLIQVLQPMRPYAYRSNIETLVSNPFGEFRHLWWDNISLHSQLLSLYSTLHERKTDEYPDPFAILLHNQIGRHPDPNRFIEISLQHFQDKQADHYFAFLHQLTEVYATPEYVQNWVRAFQNLLRERLQDAHQLFRWFMASRERYREQPVSGAEPNPAYEQWDRQLRLELSIWIERRKFYRNNPFVVLLYCELIPGIKPPLAPVLAMLCDLQPLPEYDQFETERKKLFYRLFYQSFEEFGTKLPQTYTFSRRKDIQKDVIVFHSIEKLFVVETTYDPTIFGQLYAKGFVTEFTLSCQIYIGQKEFQKHQSLIRSMIDLVNNVQNGDEFARNSSRELLDGLNVPVGEEEKKLADSYI